MIIRGSTSIDEHQIKYNYKELKVVGEGMFEFGALYNSCFAIHLHLTLRLDSYFRMQSHAFRSDGYIAIYSPTKSLFGPTCIEFQLNE